MINSSIKALLILIVTFSAACNTASDPEKAVLTFINAVNDGRCDDAFNLLSARTRYALDSLRVKPQHRHSPVPIESYYCNQLIFEDCKTGQMTLSEQQSDTAKVSMPCGRTQDSFLPGWPSIFLKYEPRETQLAFEDGEWRVILPYVVRIVEVREKEEKMIEEYKIEHMKRQRQKTPGVTAKDMPQPPAAVPFPR